MSAFLDAISNLRGRLVEVGTQGEWSDKGELQTVAQDHIVLSQLGSDRVIIVKIDTIEYIKELPPNQRNVTRIAK
ncbi:MAG: hypothetical protein AB1489_18505 [Acidobacteriota bacterium]